MRESFQVLDRDNDGQVNTTDVAEVLTQLGLDTSAGSLSPYFSGSHLQSISLPNYLNTLAGLLASISAPAELNAAFGAFDIDDSGQIDIDDLREALLHTFPEKEERQMSAADVDAATEGFTGRRALTRGMVGNDVGKRGDVFRYAEWMCQFTGGKLQEDAASVDGVRA